MDTDWMSRSRCQGIDAPLFFPSDRVGVQVAPSVCAQGAVVFPCLEGALVKRIDVGVWGGASEKLRRRLAAASSSSAIRARPRR